MSVSAQEVRALLGARKAIRAKARSPWSFRFMTMPGVRAVGALTFRSATDDPTRFSSSKKVGPWAALTPSRHQSGERDVTNGITRTGDANLCRAATVMMHRGRSSWLGTWATQVAKRRGRKRGMVALARRIGSVLRRMWKDDTVFQADAPPTATPN